MTEKIKILDYKQLKQKVNRLSWQIYENNINELNLVIVGISDRGSILAKELMKVIEKISNIKGGKNNPLKDEDIDNKFLMCGGKKNILNKIRNQKYKKKNLKEIIF